MMVLDESLKILETGIRVGSGNLPLSDKPSPHKFREAMDFVIGKLSKGVLVPEEVFEDMLSLISSLSETGNREALEFRLKVKQFKNDE